MTTQLFQTIHFAGLVIYSTLVFFFSAYVGFCRFAKKHNTLIAIRRFRWFGAILGLSMGAIILGGIVLHYGSTWGLSGAYAVNMEFMTLKYVVFAILWVSNFQLEIWTLQGVRSLDPNCKLTADELTPAYTTAAKRVSNQLFFNSGLLVLLCFISMG